MARTRITPEEYYALWELLYALGNNGYFEKFPEAVELRYGKIRDKCAVLGRVVGSSPDIVPKVPKKKGR